MRDGDDRGIEHCRAARAPAIAAHFDCARRIRHISIDEARNRIVRGGDQPDEPALAVRRDVRRGDEGGLGARRRVERLHHATFLDHEDLRVARDRGDIERLVEPRADAPDPDAFPAVGDGDRDGARGVGLPVGDTDLHVIDIVLPRIGRRLEIGRRHEPHQPRRGDGEACRISAAGDVVGQRAAVRIGRDRLIGIGRVLDDIGGCRGGEARRAVGGRRRRGATTIAPGASPTAARRQQQRERQAAGRSPRREWMRQERNGQHGTLQTIAREIIASRFQAACSGQRTIPASVAPRLALSPPEWRYRPPIVPGPDRRRPATTLRPVPRH